MKRFAAAIGDHAGHGRATTAHVVEGRPGVIAQELAAGHGSLASDDCTSGRPRNSGPVRGSPGRCHARLLRQPRHARTRHAAAGEPAWHLSRRAAHPASEIDCRSRARACAPWQPRSWLVSAPCFLRRFPTNWWLPWLTSPGRFARRRHGRATVTRRSSVR